MRLPRLEKFALPGILLLIVLVFFYRILGMSGSLTILGVVALFIIPIYFILDAFALDEAERITFSLFLGAGLFPAITFWAGFLISFRVAVIITFLLLLALGLLARNFKGNEHV